jgi:membrane protease YdiL (CAAX protease family)
MLKLIQYYKLNMQIKHSSRNLIKFFINTKGIICFIFFFLVPIILIFFVQKYLLIFDNKLFINFADDKLFLLFLQYFFIFIFLILLFSIRKRIFNFFSNENWFSSLGKALIPAILAFGLGFLITFLITILSDILPLPKDIRNWINLPNQGYIEIFEQIKNENYIKIVLWFAFITILAPIFEEILFRGFLQDSIEKIFGKYNLDIFIVSFIFGLFHITSLSNAIFAFIVGCFLSRQRKITGNINSSIWIHCIINFTGLVYGIIIQFKILQ